MPPFWSQSPALGVLVIVGLPLAGMALAAFIVYIDMHFKARRAERVLETLKHLADRGMPAPANLLELIDDSLFDPGRRARRSPWTSAITTIGAGIGLMLMFWLLGLKFLTGIGVLVLCVGVAQVIALWVESRRSPPTSV